MNTAEHTATASVAVPPKTYSNSGNAGKAARKALGQHAKPGVDFTVTKLALDAFAWSPTSAPAVEPAPPAKAFTPTPQVPAIPGMTPLGLKPGRDPYFGMAPSCADEHRKTDEAAARRGTMAALAGDAAVVVKAARKPRTPKAKTPKAPRAVKAPAAPKAPRAGGKPPSEWNQDSKDAKCLALISRQGGATVAEIRAATGWKGKIENGPKRVAELAGRTLTSEGTGEECRFDASQLKA